MKVLMKIIFVFYSFVILSISSANAQDWVKDWIAKNQSAVSKPDRIVKFLINDFQKAVGKPAPTFSFQRIDNDKFKKLNDFKGKVMLVNIWGTGCSGCRYEMPYLSHLQDSLSAKGLQVIYLSPESKNILTRYFNVNKISGIKGIIKTNQLKEPYQYLAVPSTFVIDRKGIVRDAWLGPLKFNVLVKKVLPYLTSEPDNI